MRLSILLLMVGFTALACASQLPATTDSSQTSPGDGSVKTMSVEELSNRAQVMFNQSVKDGRSREDAVQEVAAFLKSQPNVSDVRVTGSDTIRVFFRDGNDILLLLGQDRL
jgi:hypothetical protein